MNVKRKLLVYQPEVGQALEEGKPVVALESTIIAHGLPFPHNIETARMLEQTIREAGAVPATLAILGGKLRVGLSENELERLARSQEVIKASRRDLPFVVAQKADAATTVAATMYIAHAAGIRVFATGGIGGVHRGVEKTGDISADLPELARTPVVVVSAGAKAILDLPRTLEYLETWGVPVVGYQTDFFPAFYSRKSGLKVPFRLDTPDAIAALLRAGRALGLGGGMLVANPVPQKFALPYDRIESWVQSALQAADQAGVGGKKLTPYLLDWIAGHSGGDSVRTNVELVRNNALLAAKIAACL